MHLSLWGTLWCQAVTQCDLHKGVKLWKDGSTEEAGYFLGHRWNWNFESTTFVSCRFHWPSGLRRSSSASRLLKSWVRIIPGAWTFVCCVCCVCCQVEVSATSWSLVKRSPTDCGASLCVTRNLVNEEALTQCGLLHQKQTNILFFLSLPAFLNRSKLILLRIRYSRYAKRH